MGDLEKEKNQKTGGQIIAEHLICNKIDKVFSVPGESFLGAMDAFYERRNEIEFINCRQEGGATFMAAAYAKITGKPGICFVTRGPGATNASIGVHVARQDSVPLILFVGQVTVSSTHREAFQEIDIPAMFKPLAKWSVTIDQASRLPELLSRAFKVAMSGRPGPVVISLPEDVQREIFKTPLPVITTPFCSSPSLPQMTKLVNLVSAAEKPLIALGSSTWNAQACRQLADFAEKHNIPVVTSFRCQDKINNDHSNYVGVIGVGTPSYISKYVDDSDLLIMLGVELSEIVTEGFTKYSFPKMQQKLVHVHPDEEELGRVYQPDLAIHSGMAEFIDLLVKQDFVRHSDNSTALKAMRAEYTKFTSPTSCPGEVHIGEIMSWLDKRLPSDTFISCGAGNYTHWLLRFIKHREYATQLAPLGAVMGYGVPAAIAASIEFPERISIAFAGDGCFLMNAQEIATAKKYNASPIFIVLNNGIYGSIRMHQEREFPTRSIGTDLNNPDFVSYAEAFGIKGYRVSQTREFESVFENALKTEGPSLIELVVSEEAISPAFTLSELVEQSLKKKAN